MQKKTILYLITQSELGGAQKYVFDLARNFKNDFNVLVASGEQGEHGEMAQKLQEENIRFYNIPFLYRKISPTYDLSAFYEIYKLLQKTKPDIIHLNSSKISILGSLAGIFYNFNANKKTKIVYTAHGWVFNEPMSKTKKLFYKYNESLTSVFKDKIICVSDYDKKIALQEKIAVSSKLVTIHNGIEKIDFYQKDKAQEIINKIIKKNIAEFDKKIVSIGNLYPTKGFEYLICAFADIVKKESQSALFVIGEGEERKKLKTQIKKLNLENNVFLLGRIENGAKLLNAFDLYVCSSLKEGLSYTVIEAMQSDLPIIATDVGGNSELIKNKQDGIIIKAGQKNEIVEAVLKIFNNPKYAQKLSYNSQKKSLAKFSLRQMINKTKEIYKTILCHPSERKKS